MTTPITALNHLRRPRLLMAAARFGQNEYDRSKSLARILRTDCTPAPGHALDELLRQEAETDDARRSGSATYSVARHIDLLIALLGEARHAARGAA